SCGFMQGFVVLSHFHTDNSGHTCIKSHTHTHTHTHCIWHPYS
uniref:Uncharacterized protein n=1 Tax=Latimeria chalumnae TaxID=7897 RepID=H3B308_LATCH